MTKLRKNNNVMKRIKKTAKHTLPTVNKGLKNVGNTAKNVVEASIPIVEKGVSTVYGTMASGLDLGVKGVNSLTKKVNRRNKSRTRSVAGSKKSRKKYRKKNIIAKTNSR